MATSSSDIVLNGITQIFRGAAMRSTGGEFKAVDDVSFTLSADPPSIVSLVGQSGSGKSTIARIILGLQKPTQGSVTYRGKDIYKLSAREYDAYRQEIQPVFQDPYGIFNPFYRVDRIFWTAIKKFKLASNRQQALSKIEESLHAVDLRPEDILNRYPHQLSGGQRQRVMLARVHLLQPKFIIADEPISMLDAAVRVLFLNILIDFQQKYGMTTLFITHDLSTAYYVGGEILVMSKGQIVERGDIDNVLVHPTHPYTKMLLSSIPIPDPDARWQDKTSLVDIEGATPSVELPDMEVPR
ncbi:ABC transporter ATP-binding protein [Dictyobacter formicarum]|uniref:ABC transporter ATP-binding protein n=1 Tax=Dictyobacter formicarum TaxID=2778368 RepID=A0ABQ3VQ19_9CHLR|nr:ABC transporter ATP-binding protein [Dictyobacter formicarum]GHO87476.1 ABC transporter ATP-binding protein [Dictyobacter formicarum]